jgi:hypothetical protein
MGNFTYTFNLTRGNVNHELTAEFNITLPHKEYMDEPEEYGESALVHKSVCYSDTNIHFGRLDEDEVERIEAEALLAAMEEDDSEFDSCDFDDADDNYDDCFALD